MIKRKTVEHKFHVQHEAIAFNIESVKCNNIAISRFIRAPLNSNRRLESKEEQRVSKKCIKHIEWKWLWSFQIDLRTCFILPIGHKIFFRNKSDKGLFSVKVSITFLRAANKKVYKHHPKLQINLFWDETDRTRINFILQTIFFFGLCYKFFIDIFRSRLVFHQFYFIYISGSQRTKIELSNSCTKYVHAG